jgi:GH24 family phage-related lysozyme (muramidase)
MPRAARRIAAPPNQTSIDDLRVGDARLCGVPDARALCSEILKWEGYRRDMYVDARDNVMTGIGHFLPNARAALALPWKHRATGLPATGHEIWAAFEQVRAQAAGHGAPAHQRASDLVLPAGFAIELATRRLERELLPALRRLCPGFDAYPLPAQRALVDMAYNLGVGRLIRFGSLIAACAQLDFRKAARYCHRWTSRAGRNEATRNLFLDAANLLPGTPGGKGGTIDTTG